MPPKFFITHSWKDIKFAKRLTDDLRKYGLEGFFDAYSIKPGDDIAGRIARGLEECDVYVPLLSPAAVASDWCELEINAAINLSLERKRPDREGKERPRIIPIVIAPCKLPTLLRGRLHIDFYQRYDDALKELLAEFGVSVHPPASIYPTHASASTPLTITPEPSHPVPQLSATEMERLYLEAMEAFYLERYQIAADALRKIIAVNPDYEDAKAKLAETERPLKLAAMYRDAFFAFQAERWSEAAQKFEALLQIAPGYADVTEKLAIAKNIAQLPDLYRRALKAIDAKQWQDAQTLLEQISSVDVNYRETKTLLVRVRDSALGELYDLASQAIDAKDWERAKALLEQIQSIAPNYRETSQRLAFVTERFSPRKIINPQNDKEMLLVPAGEFVMGEGSDAHQVYLDAFYISRYPVTNAEYKKFVDATHHPPPAHWQNGKIPPGKENHPVVNVSWNDAVAYAQWAGARLPTEAEWEKAASWDDIKKEKRVYPWGKDFDASKCNTFESGIGDTTPVGKYSPQGDSFYGVADMAGNVWEWCADWYDENYYKNSPKENPKGPASGTERVLRGGSWSYRQGSARCARRFYDHPDLSFHLDLFGFRVVVSITL